MFATEYDGDNKFIKDLATLMIRLGLFALACTSIYRVFPCKFSGKTVMWIRCVNTPLHATLLCVMLF